MKRSVLSFPCLETHSESWNYLDIIFLQTI
ncbi:hypothetical protein GDO81_015959 [Engystomops pustulosus]|uniref:Uncharacterized protein n=1 Tax=Engystomops pustulosus TaxID=76066 RepID=A0AAV7AT39_ENGPU|nr:hypothetical protein GDO81_015959 [Engystomops pustulosus]